MKGHERTIKHEKNCRMSVRNNNIEGYKKTGQDVTNVDVSDLIEFQIDDYFP